MFDATQVSTSTVNPRIFLLTGLPGCGKTTLVRRVIERLGVLRMAGFYTQELLGDDGRRVGFEAIGLHGDRAGLAHVRSKSTIRVGRYGVELEGFEELIGDELASDADVNLFVVDEIGKMECFSELFVDAVRQILDGNVPLLATIAFKGGGFIEQVKQRDDVELITVAPNNRDELSVDLVARFRSL
jgi:nucleoside-triphosphatase